jgi:hypothetical protein
MAALFVEQAVPLAWGKLHLHADGTYQMVPPFRSADVPWPRRMRIKIAVKADAAAAPTFEAADIELFQDGTYELQPCGNASG